MWQKFALTLSTFRHLKVRFSMLLWQLQIRVEQAFHLVQFNGDQRSSIDYDFYLLALFQSRFRWQLASSDEMSHTMQGDASFYEPIAKLCGILPLFHQLSCLMYKIVQIRMPRANTIVTCDPSMTWPDKPLSNCSLFLYLGHRLFNMTPLSLSRRSRFVRTNHLVLVRGKLTHPTDPLNN